MRPLRFLVVFFGAFVLGAIVRGGSVQGSASPDVTLSSPRLETEALPGISSVSADLNPWGRLPAAENNRWSGDGEEEESADGDSFLVVSARRLGPNVPQVRSAGRTSVPLGRTCAELCVFLC